jgi:Methyltransferase domain
MEIHRVIETIGSDPRFVTQHYSDPNRLELWSSLINGMKPKVCAEIGVFRGNFAQHILRNCSTIERYFMLDPWRHLDNWNKPANVADDEFQEIKREAMCTTEFASYKRVVLEGRTTDVSNDLPDEGLDFAYIDGDHTLRGITIDLMRIWPKIRNGGVLAGDDFFASVWHHAPHFEPTLVFPLAVYFAEAIGATIYGLPNSQFAIVVDREARNAFAFRDLTGSYKSLALRDALVHTSQKTSNGLAKKALRKLKRVMTSNWSRSHLC